MTHLMHFSWSSDRLSGGCISPSIRGAALRVFLGLAFLLLPALAFGQATPPWADAAQPKKPEVAAVVESQLPLVRAHVEGGGKAWVGQAVPLIVEVIVPTWFAGSPKFPDLEVPNAVTLHPEGTVNLVVQSGGKTFAGQSLRYLIFPQVKGLYTIPPVKVEVAYALPDGKSSPRTVLASPPLRIEVRVPPGADKAKYFLTTDVFQVSQSLNRKPDDLRVGDSLERTITMTANRTVGISLPPLKFEAPDGVRVYHGAPRVLETAERGAVAATRTETATYVPEKEGRYSLPEITILWWNPQTTAMNRATLPAIELKVQAGAAYNPEVFASSQSDGGAPGRAPTDRRWLMRTISRWGLALLAAILIFLAIGRILAVRGISLSGYLAERRKKIGEAEATYFKLFRRASLANDPAIAMRCLMSWLDHAYTGLPVPTLTRFVGESGMPELAKVTTELEDLLFAPRTKAEQSRVGGGWSGRRFYMLVAKARILKRKKGAPRHREIPLVQTIN
jgi:hypothetical protein